MNRKVFMLTAGLLCLVRISPAQAQAGRISLYSDPGWSNTVAYDTVPGSLTVYVVHDHTIDGWRAASFKIDSGAGFTGVWVGETSPYTVTLGTSPTGIDIYYGSCTPLPTHLLTITYQTFGTSAACSYLESAPHPDRPEGYIVTTTCSGYHIPSESGRLFINPDSTCTQVPVRTTSWGSIKSLYVSN